MTLQFPNRSRNYDASSERVRFTGYDGMFAVSFAVESAALRLPGGAGEERALAAFDAARNSVYDVAKEAYSNARKTSYVLSAADFR
jgi:hypothetical protein